MNVRIPVIVPRGIWLSNSIVSIDFFEYPELSARGWDRHVRREKADHRSLLPLVYHESFDPGDNTLRSLTLETKNVRNAVAAVIVNAMFAAMNCQ